MFWSNYNSQKGQKKRNNEVKKAVYSLTEKTFVNLYLSYWSYLGRIFHSLACKQESLSYKKVSIFILWKLILVWKKKKLFKVLDGFSNIL